MRVADRQRATEGCEHTACNEKNPLAVTRERGKQRVPEYGTNSCSKGGSDATKTNLEWDWTVHFRDQEWPEIEDTEEVHAGYEGNAESQYDDTLALEKLAGDHRVTGELEFPGDPAEDEQETNDERAQRVRGRPLVVVTAGLECHEEQRQADNGQEAAREVNALENSLGRQAFSTDLS